MPQLHVFNPTITAPFLSVICFLIVANCLPQNIYGYDVSYNCREICLAVSFIINNCVAIYKNYEWKLTVTPDKSKGGDKNTCGAYHK